uniref:Protein disulfide-isomerase n=1 Tax=Oncorhynchus mykiss TaxID=8022 RepID=A0A8C7LNR8_ONCMY
LNSAAMGTLSPFRMFLLFALAQQKVFVAASDVLELGDSDFDDMVAEYETVLVEFFAPWCGHCQQLAPEYETAATKLKGTVSLAKVDCTVNSETCGRFGVNGYPTLKIFRNGEDFAAYDGPRSADGIVSYMKKQAGPSSVPLHNERDLDAFVNHFEASVVGFFSSADSSQMAEFLKASSAMRDSHRFAHTADLSLVVPYNDVTILVSLLTSMVVLFRPPRLNSKFEDSLVKSEAVSIASLRQFIRDNVFGLCPHLTAENRENMRGRDLLVAYYDVDYLRNIKGTNYWRNRVMKVATQFQSQGLSYAVANRAEFQEELEEEFGLGPSDGGELPLITIRNREGHKYSMQEEFTTNKRLSLSNMVGRYLNKSLLPLQVVVADNFEELVNNPSKDVLLEFYAPWCGHCKSLEPKYTELGEQLSANTHIVIAKMDATANDVPPTYDVQGFPTIFFVPAGQKDQPRKYEGGREVNDFLNYLKEVATHPLILGNAREDL